MLLDVSFWDASQASQVTPERPKMLGFQKVCDGLSLRVSFHKLYPWLDQWHEIAMMIAWPTNIILYNKDHENGV